MTSEALTIERIHRPSRREFHQAYVKRNKPVILQGVIDDWPARSWTPELFQTKLRSIPVVVEVWETEENVTDADDYGKQMRHERMDLGTYVDLILSRGPSKQYYLVQCPIFEKAPELKGAIKPFGYYSELIKQLIIPDLFWLGPAGTVTPAHFDFAHNFLVQICGRKQLTMFPPDQSPYLYHPHNLKKWNFSPVDVESPDLEKFPLFAKATPFKAVLEPGEVLFIPRPWWHHVRALDTSISLNFWWATPVEALQLARRNLKKLVLHKLGLGPSLYDPA
jgi:hypothetical protein